MIVNTKAVVTLKHATRSNTPGRGGRRSNMALSLWIYRCRLQVALDYAHAEMTSLREKLASKEKETQVRNS